MNFGFRPGFLFTTIITYASVVSHTITLVVNGTRSLVTGLANWSYHSHKDI